MQVGRVRRGGCACSVACRSVDTDALQAST